MRKTERGRGEIEWNAKYFPYFKTKQNHLLVQISESSVVLVAQLWILF